MTEPLTHGYDPAGVEARHYAMWEAAGYFAADPLSPAPPFCIVIPPPNVTGSLHMGHALNNTLQDILVRWRRLQGRSTLWMPGTDHAGIATQNVVERQLLREGRTRDGLGREAFVARVWQWREESGGAIIGQLKRLGASCDWAREAFTMDEPRARAVREAFVRLWEDGLLYRAERLVNWCPRCRTALADLEVEYEERDGQLWHVRYPFVDDPAGGLVVATTRPETMLGDTAVAVNPDDPRYAAAVGRQVVLPVVGRRLPVIADPYVAMDFGTGALKVTPAHDPNDFEIGERHHLARVNAFNPDGTISASFLVDATGRPVESPRAARYVGRDRAEVRKLIVEDLRADGLLVRAEPYRHAVGQCYRCATVIEPFLTPQWFVRAGPLAEPAIRAVEEGRTRFVPRQWENTYFEWMRNIRDWCISRQIWWGHQIPAWYCRACERDHLLAGVGGALTVLPGARPLVARERPAACPRCGGADLVQDPDVLDTWFSSALWPFSTLGWPEGTPELKRFYPTAVLVTGFDIIFFWVARMLMMGLKCMGEVPFRDVVIHGLVLDEEGHKQSKTRGNVVDPLDLIARFGADALRMTLASQAAQGRDVRVSEQRVEGYRHFCNKVWNAYRFVAGHLEGKPVAAGPWQTLPLDPMDRWILARLDETIGAVTEALEAYRFDEAARAVYEFIWHEYCDWYLEVAKVRLQEGGDLQGQAAVRRVLVTALEGGLRLLHPMMPFLTEEIWQRLPHEGPSIMVASWPKPLRLTPADAAELKVAEAFMAITGAVREIRAEMNIAPSLQLASVHLRTDSAAHLQAVATLGGPLRRLARVAEVPAGPRVEFPPYSAVQALGDAVLAVPLTQSHLERERDRLRKEIGKAGAELAKIERKLGTPAFVEKAPAEVVAGVRAERDEGVAAAARLQEHLARVEASLRGA